MKRYLFDEYYVYEVAPNTYVRVMHGDQLARVLGGFDPEGLECQVGDAVFTPAEDEFGFFTDGHLAT